MSEEILQIIKLMDIPYLVPFNKNNKKTELELDVKS